VITGTTVYESNTAALSAKVRGHYGYYGITGNAQSLDSMRFSTMLRWRFWLNRRSSGN
jgi:hypothetical protein